jgi:hypothetical protein
MWPIYKPLWQSVQRCHCPLTDKSIQDCHGLIGDTSIRVQPALPIALWGYRYQGAICTCHRLVGDTGIRVQPTLAITLLEIPVSGCNLHLPSPCWRYQYQGATHVVDVVEKMTCLLSTCVGELEVGLSTLRYGML